MRDRLGKALAASAPQIAADPGRAESFTQSMRARFSKRVVLAGRMDYGLLVVFALPLVFLPFDSTWLFSYTMSAGYIDPWVYFGYFLDLGQHFRTFVGVYYGTRLSWVLPGFVAYHIFPPLVAAYVLHLTFYYAAVVALYLILKRTVSQRAALLASVLMGCYPYFLLALGWDYVDGAGLTYFLITLLMLTLGAEPPHRWWWLVLGGACYGAMISSQLFLVTFTPLIALYYLFTHGGDRLKGFPYFVIGAAALTSLLGVVSVLLGGDFNYFLPSLREAAWLVDQGNPWRASSYAWLPGAQWLLFPALTLFGSAVFLTFNRAVRASQRARLVLSFQVLYICTALTMIVWELYRQPVLQYGFYASYLIPTMFLAMGAQLSVVTDQLSTRGFFLLLCTVIIISVIAFALPLDSALRAAQARHALLVPVVLSLGSLALFFARAHSLRALAALFLCAALGAFGVTNGIRNAAGYASSYRLSPSLQEDAFLSVVKSVREIQAVVPKGNLLFWYSLHGPYGFLPQAVASTYLWEYTLFSENFPALDSRYQKPTLHTRMVILSTDDDAPREANQALRRIGFRARVLAERVIAQGAIVFRMTFIEVCSVTGRGC